jgi:hypothetical protein
MTPFIVHGYLQPLICHRTDWRSLLSRHFNSLFDGERDFYIFQLAFLISLRLPSLTSRRIEAARID